jgi:hypothetical protein
MFIAWVDVYLLVFYPKTLVELDSSSIRDHSV